MTLLRPRRWLAYYVCMNDLHPRASEMLDRFESSEIPLADTFGSSSDTDAPPDPFVVAFGPGVEAGRLLEVLDLLEGIDVPRLLPLATDRKNIYIGALNLAGEPTMPLTPAVLQTLRDAPDDTPRLGDLVTQPRLRLATQLLSNNPLERTSGALPRPPLMWNVSESMGSAPDWSAWSREAVRLMQDRNRTFVEEYGLQDAPYNWSFDEARIVFSLAGAGDVVADICVIGSASGSAGSFLWAWANDSIPPRARHRLDLVREFGVEHGLDLLTVAEWEGGRAEGLEAAAIAGRVLDSDGVWVDATHDVTLFFALSNFRRRPDREPR